MSAMRRGYTEAARGSGLSLAMDAQVYLAMIARGYRNDSYTTVLETWPSGGRRKNWVAGSRGISSFIE